MEIVLRDCFDSLTKVGDVIVYTILYERRPRVAKITDIIEHPVHENQVTIKVEYYNTYSHPEKDIVKGHFLGYKDFGNSFILLPKEAIKTLPPHIANYFL
jgi:hypothetical protein